MKIIKGVKSDNTFPIMQQLRNQYKINPKELGSGAYGRVYQAQNRADPSHKVAIKVISKQKLTNKEQKELNEEIEILQKLDHPNIVKYYDKYEDSTFIYLVMELCSGGELFLRNSYVQEPMSEKDASKHIYKILRALIHCHKQNICHRDIKPSNIMVGQDGEIKIIDFGLAKQFQRSNQKLHSLAGTPYFISPEVLRGSYGKECDIWSLGVVLYLLLTGRFPFEGNSQSEIFNKIKKGDVQFTDCIQSRLTKESLDLIKKMLTVNLRERVTGEQAIEHPWFNKQHILDTKHKSLDFEVMQRLKQFKGNSPLKKVMLNQLVKMLDHNQIKYLQQQFESIDKDRSGMIEVQELEEALRSSWINLPQEDIQNIVNELDYTKDGKINYSEFLAATIQVDQVLTQPKMRALFKQISTEDTDEISPDNIKSFMKRNNQEISDKEIQDLMDKYDYTGDNNLQIDELTNMMLVK